MIRIGQETLELLLALFWILVTLACITPLVLLSRFDQRRRNRRTLAKANRRVSGLDGLDALREIGERDPDFDVERFCERVSAAFHRIEAGRLRGEWELARPFTSDGLYASLVVPRGRGLVWGARGLHAVRLSVARSDRSYDMLRVQVVAQSNAARAARDASGNTRVESRVDLSAQGTIDEEFWTFLRRRDGRTPSADGLLEGRCPVCGASVHEERAARCGHCGAALRDARHDWLLVRIDSAADAAWRNADELPGVGALRAHDPGFHPCDIEDRAVWMFWNIVGSQLSGDALPRRGLHPDCTCPPLRGGAEGDQLPQRALAECVGVPAATIGDDWEHVLVRIRSRTWEAFGRLYFFVLGRHAGMQSDAAGAFTVACCRSCGAPAAPETEAGCLHCGQPMAADWVLLEVHPAHTEGAQSWLERLPAPIPERLDKREVEQGDARLLAWAAELVLADGRLRSYEEGSLLLLARRLRVADDEVDVALLERHAGTSALPEPAGRDEGLAWIDALFDLVLVRGGIRPEEWHVLTALGAHLELSVTQMRELYQHKLAARAGRA